MIGPAFAFQIIMLKIVNPLSVNYGNQKGRNGFDYLWAPRLCGVKQFYTEKMSATSFLYKTNRFEGAGFHPTKARCSGSPWSLTLFMAVSFRKCIKFPHRSLTEQFAYLDNGDHQRSILGEPPIGGFCCFTEFSIIEAEKIEEMHENSWIRAGF